MMGQKAVAQATNPVQSAQLQTGDPFFRIKPSAQAMPIPLPPPREVFCGHCVDILIRNGALKGSIDRLLAMPECEHREGHMEILDHCLKTLQESEPTRQILRNAEMALLGTCFGAVGVAAVMGIPGVMIIVAPALIAPAAVSYYLESRRQKRIRGLIRRTCSDIDADLGHSHVPVQMKGR